MCSSSCPEPGSGADDPAVSVRGAVPDDTAVVCRLLATGFGHPPPDLVAQITSGQQAARAEGAQRIGLEVAVTNERALKLYTSVGFTEVTIEDYFAVITDCPGPHSRVQSPGQCLHAERGA